MKSTRTITILALAAALLAVCPVGWAETGAGALAQRKAEFNKLVAKRNQIHAKLAQLDVQAAQAVKDGRTPTQLNAKQISTQDQLDLTRLRLETVAMRNDFVIPPPPQDDQDAASPGESARQAETRRVSAVFSRGRRRTHAELKRQTIRVLASIDYGSFLKPRGGE